MASIDLNKLIELAKVETTSTQNLGEAEKFIHVFMLKPGQLKVPATALYQVYKEWAHTPVSKNKFFREFTKYFIPHRGSAIRFYYLNKKIWEMEYKLKKLQNKT